MTHDLYEIIHRRRDVRGEFTGEGVGWVSFYREAFLQGLLGIPAGVRPVAWLCLGPVTRLREAPDLERHGWRSRRPLHLARHVDRWGGTVSPGESRDTPPA